MFLNFSENDFGKFLLLVETAPSSLDSFTQLVINSSNFYARFLSFSREYDASGKRFGEAEGEASPQSPPAGALLLKKRKRKKIFFRDFPKMQQCSLFRFFKFISLKLSS